MAFIDEVVATGQASSRAAALDKLTKRALRRARAEQDVRIYSEIQRQQTPEGAEEERAWGDMGYGQRGQGVGGT